MGIRTEKTNIVRGKSYGLHYRDAILLSLSKQNRFSTAKACFLLMAEQGINEWEKTLHASQWDQA